MSSTFFEKYVVAKNKVEKRIKIVFWLILFLLIGIQFVSSEVNQSDEILDTDFLRIYPVPNDIAQLLKVSCYDCHSNNTSYPWYSSVQPIAWLMESHITEGKEELNFNEFGNYSNRRKRNKLKSIVREIKKNKMPLRSYELMHSDANLSIEEKQLLIEWFKI